MAKRGRPKKSIQHKKTHFKNADEESRSQRIKLTEGKKIPAGKENWMKFIVMENGKPVMYAQPLVHKKFPVLSEEQICKKFSEKLAELKCSESDYKKIAKEMLKQQKEEIKRFWYEILQKILLLIWGASFVVTFFAGLFNILGSWFSVTPICSLFWYSVFSLISVFGLAIMLVGKTLEEESICEEDH